MLRPLLFSLIALFAGLSACHPARSICLHNDQLSQIDTGAVAACFPRKCNCIDWQNYLPDTSHPGHIIPRYIRVNFHILNSSDSSQNFRPDSARIFYKEFLRVANARLDTNVRNWRSPDGTRILPPNYQYILTPQPVPGDDGFYFHFDDSLYYFISSGRNQNNYNSKVVNKYAVGMDTILNLFVLVHPADSIKSKTYRAKIQGIALGNSLKMAGIYESKDSAWQHATLLNHEVGHILGLSHAWMEDGCPDTQNHPNKCWTWTETGPCRDLATDNMMDYNGYQNAMTPCQIAKVHQTFNYEKSQIRHCLLPTWCVRDPAKDLTIRDSMVWSGSADLEGSLIIAPGASLQLNCRLSLPEHGRILVMPGGRLILNGARLHNACGKNWDGIYVEQAKNSPKGRVIVLKLPIIENCPLMNTKSRRRGSSGHTTGR